MSPAAQAAAPAALPFPRQLIGLVRDPLRAFPDVFEHRRALALLGFPAISGIYVAYVFAVGLGLGDRFGALAAAAGVLTGGAALGLIAMWFAGSLPSWSAAGSDEAETDGEHMFLVFSYATWPFLPLLAILLPIELVLYGDQIFASSRPDAPATIVWGLRALQLAAIMVWLIIMLNGTALVRHESARSAARELVRWGAELVAIAVLFTIVVMASVMYW